MTADPHWALSVAVSEEFLNALAVGGIGEGIVAPELRQHFSLPMMGAVDLSVAMTIVAVEFSMRAEHDGRLHARVHATGELTVHGDSMMPAFPGLARVHADVLVAPRIELRADRSFGAVLALSTSELLSMALDGIDGMDVDVEIQAQMGQLLFAAVGADLFAGLAEGLGDVGLELAASDAEVFAELGVVTGEAEVRVDDGYLIVGLRAADDVEGHAEIAPTEGTRLGVGVAAGALTTLVNRLAGDTLGMQLPVELDVIAGERRVGGRIRNERLLHSSVIPDLRPGLRYTVRPRLVGDEIELSLREVWVELPYMPSVVNQVSRFFGGVASRAPLSVKFPASASVPVRPDSDRVMHVRVEALDIATDGVSLVVAAEF